MAADGSQCIMPPEETAGPYPADGSNSRNGQLVNVLSESGIERTDLRGNLGADGTVAQGVPLEVEFRLVNVDAACQPMEGLALYLWHCDVQGRYSLYDLPEANYLRGLQVSASDGVVRFKTIFPGCYPSRWPHMHFEVFDSREAAASGRQALLTAQIALPADDAAKIYSTVSEYGDSGRYLSSLSMERDNVFSDNTPTEREAQTLRLTGEPGKGLVGKVIVGIRPA
ncbi:hypothetical protein ACSBLW_04555 [Thioclava sp. FR2]|uniref:dioxygenase family protein n=1 Tax=Thioclava sp. FR2 TaxID=3445780 RepID=UPI003EC07608